jgi:hypothetical protein
MVVEFSQLGRVKLGSQFGKERARRPALIRRVIHQTISEVILQTLCFLEFAAKPHAIRILQNRH